MFDSVDKGELLRAVLDHYGVQYSPRTGWQSVHCFNNLAHSQNDRHASASAHVTLGRYKCHACDLSGDGWDLMLTVEGMKIKEAAQVLGFTVNGEPPPEEETWITWR